MSCSKIRLLLDCGVQRAPLSVLKNGIQQFKSCRLLTLIPQLFLCLSPIEAIAEDTVHLGNVAFFCDSKESQSLNSSLGKLECAKGTIVFAVESEETLIVLDLDSNSKDDVHLKIGNRIVDLAPGEEVVVTRDRNKLLTQLLSNLPLSFRDPKQCDLRGGIRLYQMEFSIPEALAKVKELRTLADSNKPEDKKVIRRILKNAAIINKVSMTPPHLVTETAAAAQAAVETATTPPLQGGISITRDVKTIPVNFEYDRVVDLTIPSNQHNPTLTEDVKLVEHISNSWKDPNTIPKASNKNSKSTAAVVVCSKNTLLKTHHGFVMCKKGSSAFIVDRGDDVAISMLGAEGTKDIDVIVGTGMISLRPGQQFISSKNKNNTFDKASAGLEIAFKDPLELEFGDRMLYLAEFSIPAASCVLPPLRRIVFSDKPAEQKAAHNILKSAAILHHISLKDGPYKPTKKAHE